MPLTNDELRVMLERHLSAQKPMRLVHGGKKRMSSRTMFYLALATGAAILVLSMIVCDAQAQDSFQPTEQVCWRTQATPPVELGCVQRLDFLSLTNNSFEFEGQLIFVLDTLPPSTGPIAGRRFANGDALLLAAIIDPPSGTEINFVAALRVPVSELPGAADVVARSVDAAGESVEREGVIQFAAFEAPAPPPPPDLPPRAPVLILIDELQSALDRAREQLATNE